MGLAKRFSGYVALRNDAAPAAGTGECRLYSQSGVAKIIQPDGTIVTLANSAGGTRTVTRATPLTTVLTTTQTVVMSMAIPANSLVVGTTFLIDYMDTSSANAVPTPRVRIGPLGTIADTAMIALPAPATTSALHGGYVLTIQAIGASATFFAGGRSNASTSTGTAVSGTFNSTVANTLTFSIQSGTSVTRTVRGGSIDRVSG